MVSLRFSSTVISFLDLSLEAWTQLVDRKFCIPFFLFIEVSTPPFRRLCRNETPDSFQYD